MPLTSDLRSSWSLKANIRRGLRGGCERVSTGVEERTHAGMGEDAACASS